MSDYRRWISYIYLYENGVKKDNAGYARIELQDGRVKLAMYINHARRDGVVDVCYFKSQPGHFGVARLGELDLSEPSPVFRHEGDASDMAGSGLFFQELNGILLAGRDGSYYASSWENEPVSASDVEEIRKLLANRGRGGEQETKKKETDSTQGRTEAGSEEEPKNISETSVGRQTPEKRMEPIQPGSAEKSERQPSESGQGSIRNEPETRSEERADVAMETQKMQEELMKFVQPESQENPKPQASENTLAAMEVSNGSADNTAGIPSVQSTSGVRPARTSTLEQALTAGCRNAPCSMNREERVFYCLPPMYPFEDGEFEKGVRMEPQDIGMLPRSVWKLAGNSFLLHAFYTYHHLLFMRKRQKDGAVCYLMLPGVYEKKEQRMAQMFGFSNFRPVKSQQLDSGAFGYWYMEIRF